MKKIYYLAALAILAFVGCVPQQSEFNFEDIPNKAVVQGIVKIDKGYVADAAGVVSQVIEAADPAKLKIMAYTAYADNYDASGEAKGMKLWPGTAKVENGQCQFTIEIPVGSQGLSIDHIEISSTEALEYGALFQNNVETVKVDYQKSVNVGKSLYSGDKYILPAIVSLVPVTEGELTGTYPMELYGWAYAAVEEATKTSGEYTKFAWAKVAASTTLLLTLTNGEGTQIKAKIEPSEIGSNGYYGITFNLPKRSSWDLTDQATVNIKIEALPYEKKGFEHWYYNSDKDRWQTQDDLTVEYNFKTITDALSANDAYKGKHQLTEMYMGGASGEITFFEEPAILGLGSDADYKDGERIYWNNDGTVYNFCIYSDDENYGERYYPSSPENPYPENY